MVGMANVTGRSSSALTSCLPPTQSLRWNGYNADSHAQVMQRFEALEGQRREERQKTIEQKLSTGVEFDHFLYLASSQLLQGSFLKVWTKTTRKTILGTTPSVSISTPKTGNQSAIYAFARTPPSFCSIWTLTAHITTLAHVL